VAEILEHVVVELFGIVGYDVLWDTIAADDVLAKKILDSCRAYV
jgi:hypothetical protein